jgi:hypothetical protein
MTKSASTEDVRAAENMLKRYADKLGLTIRAYHSYAYTTGRGTPTLYLRSFVPYVDEYVVDMKKTFKEEEA